MSRIPNKILVYKSIESNEPIELQIKKSNNTVKKVSLLDIFQSTMKIRELILNIQRNLTNSNSEEKQTKKIYGTEQNQSSNTNLKTSSMSDVNIEVPATSSKLVVESYLPLKRRKRNK